LDATNPPDPRPELTPPAPTDAAPPEEQTLRGWLVQNGILIAVLAAVGVAIWWRARPDNPLAILSVVVGLGLLIFIHELGHFLAAKWCDVHVETFSVGFGPPIPGCAFRWGETTYMVGLVPLGGYVKMVGEGADSEEGEDDPRSFKNKTVIQRMIIISAGVVMNLLLGLACFVFVALTHGIREIPAVVGTVAPGTPAWEADVRRGDVIERVGSRSEPAFNDISLGVMKSADGVPIEVADAHVIGGKVQPPEVKRITPREVAGSPLPMFGLAPSARTTLGRSERKLPFRLNSPAAAATNPGFAIGDVVVATTDPDQPDPDKLLDLPPDPRVAPNEQAQPDFFTLRERLQRMADREIVLRVRRAHPRQHGGNVTEDIRVGRAPTHTLGLVMRMGPVVAIRAGSPAEVAQVRKTVAEEPDRGSALDPSWWIFGSRRSATPRQAVKGDRIETVELDLPPGSDKAIRRFTAVPLPDDPRAETRPLDPVRLPWELQRWAAAWRALPPEQRKDEVRLTVSRSEPKDAHDEAPRTVPLTLRWDDSRTFDDEAVFDPSSPLPIPGLGLAYAVEPVVAAVEPGSPAAEAGFEKDDVVTEIAFFEIGPDGNPTATARPVALEDDRKQPLPRWAGG
jgi:regulator of sigma E protease